MMGSMMQDLAFAIPGVDEAMSFAEIMKYVKIHHYLALFDPRNLPLWMCRHVKSMEYSAIVFDTAPTGHTLRFLSFPSVLEKALGKLSTLSGRIGPMINQVCIAFVSASRRYSFRVDVYADGRPSGSYRRHVLEARINACGDHRSEHAI